MPVDLEKIAAGVRLILEGVGDNPDREGIKETPDRVARLYAEVFSGMDLDPSQLLIPMPGDRHQELILVRDIHFYSMCEHHLLPFYGQAHVGYVPSKDGCITGLSKLARTVRAMAARPQLQERMTSQIADTLVERLAPVGVFVMVEAEHLCMSMRGVRAVGAKTTTSALRGQFLSDAAARSEVLALITRP